MYKCIRFMWSFLRKIFGSSDADVYTTSDADSTETQADDSQDNTSGKEESDSRTFDITECDDIEIEEIDGELH